MELTRLDHRILATIRNVRAEHWACTGREVAAVLELTPTIVARRLKLLHKAGIVVSTPVPGSLRIDGFK